MLRQTRRAFTLIEILVVVAIIALLIAILIPSLQRARESARRSVCMSNLHQLAMCWMQYYTDNRGVLVYGGNGGDPATTGPGWVLFIGYLPADQPAETQLQAIRGGALYRYCHSVDIYRCPGTKKNELRTYGCCASLRTNVRDWYPALPAGMSIPLAQKIDDLKRPCARMVFVDDSPEDWDASWMTWYEKNAFWNHLELRHDKGTTLPFGDGHAEWWRWVDHRTCEYFAQSWHDAENRIFSNPTLPDNRDIRRMRLSFWGTIPPGT
jgi:prepilin-type N-terminal cleavage/methylation domain-containing protein